MEVIEKNGFKIRVCNDSEKYLLLNNENVLTGSRFMINNHIKRLELNYVFGFTMDSTEFLKDYTFVDDLAIIPAPNINIEGVKNLQYSLRKLRITYPISKTWIYPSSQI